MKRKFIDELIQMDSNDQVMKALDQRRSEILGAIADRVIEPTDELMRELAELNIALGDVDLPIPGEE